MDITTNQRNIDVKVCLKILKDKEYLHPSQKINLDTYYVIFISRSKHIGWYKYNGGIGGTLLSFGDIFQSFTDPERPTEEEFVMFKLQYGVDWIVEPLNVSTEGITK